MKVLTALKAGAALAMLSLLAACIDVEMKIEMLDSETARGTMTMSMDRQFYDMSVAQGGESFCDDDANLTVGDTLVTCVDSEEGPFAEVIDAEEGEPAPTLTDLGDGTVRITFPSGAMQADLANEKPDEQTLQMMASMFEGKMFTFAVAGKEVVETNMTKSDDGTTATYSIAMLSLIDGSAEMPDELYAIVRVQ